MQDWIYNDNEEIKKIRKFLGAHGGLADEFFCNDDDNKAFSTGSYIDSSEGPITPLSSSKWAQKVFQVDDSPQYQISILDHLKFTPTFEQNRALNEMSNFVKEGNTNDFLILSGSAGTGKTSITTALIGYLNTCAISYNIAAPTGRAARILGRKSQTLNSTIHSLIYDPIVNQKTGVITFKLKKNIVKDYTVFIIDEASMISSKTTYDKLPSLSKIELPKTGPEILIKLPSSSVFKSERVFPIVAIIVVPYGLVAASRSSKPCP